MRSIRVDASAPDPGMIEQAARLLRQGGLVAFPTETVYGLGGNALDAAAVQRIFEAKGRPAFNPLIAHVSDVAGARELASSWPDAAEALAARFWPGPLTLVVAKRPDIPDVVTAGRGTVALRVPAHPVAAALLRAADLPIAAPSANRFTRISPTTAEHVERGLGGRVDLILDGGPTSVGIESTVVDLSGDEPVLLRPGSIPAAALEAVVGPFGQAPTMTGAEARPSPGMVQRHYSPRAQLLVFAEGRRGEMVRVVEEAAAAGRTTGALLLHPLDAPVIHPVRMPSEAAAYARELYSRLHQLDDLGCELMVADAVPGGPEWAGVRDRLARAAHQG